MIFCVTNCVDNLTVHKISSVAELFINGFVSVAGNGQFSVDLQCLSSLKRLYHYMYRQPFSRIASIFTSEVFLNKVNLHFTVRWLHYESVFRTRYWRIPMGKNGVRVVDGWLIGNNTLRRRFYHWSCPWFEVNEIRPGSGNFVFPFSASLL